MQTILIYFSIGVVVGYIGYRILRGEVAKIHQTEGEHKDQLILNYIKGKGRVQNHDIQKLLNVSDATVTRYLQKLEDEGRVVQEGVTGRSVFYRLK